METEEEINEKIVKITGQIREKYPELYVNLGEMPVTIPDKETPEINSKRLKEYYDSLVSMFKHYQTTHKK